MRRKTEKRHEFPFALKMGERALVTKGKGFCERPTRGCRRAIGGNKAGEVKITCSITKIQDKNGETHEELKTVVGGWGKLSVSHNGHVSRLRLGQKKKNLSNQTLS